MNDKTRELMKERREIERDILSYSSEKEIAEYVRLRELLNELEDCERRLYLAEEEDE